MRKFLVVSPETLVNLGKVFSDNEEFRTFITQMEHTVNELTFYSLLRNKVSEDEATVTVLQQICIFSLFCREHMEVIQELVRKLEGKHMTEDELKDLLE